MTWPRPIRFVGIGSPQGDDALAWNVVSQLRERLSDRRDVEFHLLEGGQRLLDVIDGQGTLLLIDALAGETTGIIHRFEWPDPRVQVLRPRSTHQMRPAEALQLAEALGILPLRVIVFAIEASCFDPGAAPSTAAEKAVCELVCRLVDEFSEPGNAR